MDSGSAPPPAYCAAPEIPPEIFQPLVAIARQGYDADDVKRYYLIMLRHLRRMGVENADAAYTLITPVSDKKAPLYNSDEDESSVQQSVELTEDHISPGPGPSGYSWSRSASYEPSYDGSIQPTNDISVIPICQQDYEPSLNATQDIQVQTPQSIALQDFPESSQGQPQVVPMMSPNYSPTRMSPQYRDANEVYVANHNPAGYAGESSRSAGQWFSPEDLNRVSGPPPMQYPPAWVTPAPTPAPYQMAMSNTQMPLLVPYHPPPPQPQPGYTEDLINPFSSGLGLTQLANELYSSPFFPTIDVIPSRKRRKVLQKGAKTILQTFQNSRQHSI